MLSVNVSIDIKFYNQHFIFTHRIKQAAGEKQSEQNRLNNVKKSAAENSQRTKVWLFPVNGGREGVYCLINIICRRSRREH